MNLSLWLRFNTIGLHAQGACTGASSNYNWQIDYDAYKTHNDSMVAAN